jgi:hypothetical protein
LAADNLAQALNRAIRLIQEGYAEQARPILYELSQTYPEHEAVWLWLAAAAQNDAERVQALRRVLAINPRNAKARAALERLTGESPPPAPLPQVKLPAIKLSAPKLPPDFWQSVQTALIVILVGLTAFVIVFLAGSAIVPALTPPSATPTATFTRTPRPTVPSPTPVPTLVLPPTWTPEPTVTPRPANTRRPSLTPRPTNTRVPSRTPTPTFTRPPTNTPTPSETPTPSPTVPTLTPTETPTPI